MCCVLYHDVKCRLSSLLIEPVLFQLSTNCYHFCQIQVLCVLFLPLADMRASKSSVCKDLFPSEWGRKRRTLCM
ncbi:hypothetical protein GBAR_LOCUS3916 [Geodia barretti]|uniref:Uncharacterized protein n=1 Tax=Geodia barretti TaxID=519541 RepID=A0AA35W1Q9_GEOBA|nr:hypothetical protein GBAR_LOCUS3916 [Geodia barretti]